MRISDWSSDVCSSDLVAVQRGFDGLARVGIAGGLDVIERQYRAPTLDADPIHDPVAIGADIEITQECVVDDVFRMEVAKAVNIGHCRCPAITAARYVRHHRRGSARRSPTPLRPGTSGR